MNKYTDIDLRDVEQKHLELMCAYEKVLRESEDLPFIFELRDDTPDYLKSIKRFREGNLFQKTFYRLVRPILNNPVDFSRKRSHPTLFSKIFLHSHIAGKLKVLRRIYLAEILAFKIKNESDKEILDRFRDYCSDMERLSETLTNWKTSFGFTGFNVLTLAVLILSFIDLFKRNQIFLKNFLLPIGIVVFYLFVIGVLSFAPKRAILMRSTSYNEISGFMSTNLDKVYKNSIYKTENDLFIALKVKKPLEIQGDIIILSFILFFLILMIIAVTMSAPAQKVNQLSLIFYWIFSFIIFFSYSFMIYRAYINRKDSGLM